MFFRVGDERLRFIVGCLGFTLDVVLSIVRILYYFKRFLKIFGYW